jgi:hypothetical protein
MEDEHDWPGREYLTIGFAAFLAGDAEGQRAALHRLAAECRIKATFTRVDDELELTDGLDLK